MKFLWKGTDTNSEYLSLSNSSHHCWDIVDLDISHRIGRGDGRCYIGSIKFALQSSLMHKNLQRKFEHHYYIDYLIHEIIIKYLFVVRIRSTSDLSYGTDMFKRMCCVAPVATIEIHTVDQLLLTV